MNFFAFWNCFILCGRSQSEFNNKSNLKSPQIQVSSRQEYHNISQLPLISSIKFQTPHQINEPSNQQKNLSISNITHSKCHSSQLNSAFVTTQLILQTPKTPSFQEISSYKIGKDFAQKLRKLHKKESESIWDTYEDQFDLSTNSRRMKTFEEGKGDVSSSNSNNNNNTEDLFKDKIKKMLLIPNFSSQSLNRTENSCKNNESCNKINTEGDARPMFQQNSSLQRRQSCDSENMDQNWTSGVLNDLDKQVSEFSKKWEQFEQQQKGLHHTYLNQSSYYTQDSSNQFKNEDQKQKVFNQNLKEQCLKISFNYQFSFEQFEQYEDIELNSKKKESIQQSSSPSQKIDEKNENDILNEKNQNKRQNISEAIANIRSLKSQIQIKREENISNQTLQINQESSKESVSLEMEDIRNQIREKILLSSKIPNDDYENNYQSKQQKSQIKEAKDSLSSSLVFDDQIKKLNQITIEKNKENNETFPIIKVENSQQIKLPIENYKKDLQIDNTEIDSKSKSSEQQIYCQQSSFKNTNKMYVIQEEEIKFETPEAEENNNFSNNNNQTNGIEDINNYDQFNEIYDSVGQLILSKNNFRYSPPSSNEQNKVIEKEEQKDEIKERQYVNFENLEELKIQSFNLDKEEKGIGEQQIEIQANQILQEEFSINVITKFEERLKDCMKRRVKNLPLEQIF